MSTKYVLALFILSGLLVITAKTAGATEEMRSNAPRSLYAVNESSRDRGSISVYDIDAGHRLIKTIQTVPGVGDIRGVALSAVTGKLYVAYRDVSGTGMVYCLDVYNDSALWNRAIAPGVDRLAINPDGRLLYVPTWKAVRRTTSMSSMPRQATLFERCTSQIHRTTLNTPYRGRFSERRRLKTAAAITSI